MADSMMRRAFVAYEATLSFSLQKGRPECERAGPFFMQHKRQLSDAPTRELYASVVARSA